ncbi:MAG: FtsW/RodA/SpoVE family cell cycle protein [Cellulosilyticaceae bacterium]
MAYFNLMILLSRYVFAGFAVVFIIVAFSFMKPFVSYKLGSSSAKNRLLAICTTFFQLGAMGILVGKQPNATIKAEMIVNAVILFALFIVTRWLLRLWKRQDELILWNIVFFLMTIGYVVLERLDHASATKQVIWAVLGVAVAFVLPNLLSALINPKHKMMYLIFVAICLVLPFIFGSSKYGALNWVQIGPVGFQPSEFGKIGLVLYLAAYFGDPRVGSCKNKSFMYWMLPTGVVGAFVICLVLQRDLGGALLYYLTFLIMLLVGTEKIWLPLVGLGVAGVGSVAGYKLFGHVRVRVEAWLNPWKDVSGGGYQVVQGLFAMGTWGWFGSGLTRGIPNKIPIVTTDYIFAAICEELGNLVGVIVLLCFLGLVLQGLAIALKQKNVFYLMIAIGFVAILGIQTFIIIGGVLKLIPLTGITLPFVSYGGTSLVVSLGMIGLLSYLKTENGKAEKKEGATNEK